MLFWARKENLLLRNLLSDSILSDYQQKTIGAIGPYCLFIYLCPYDKNRE